MDLLMDTLGRRQTVRAPRLRDLYDQQYAQAFAALQTASHPTFGDISSWHLFVQGLYWQLGRVRTGRGTSLLEQARHAWSDSDLTGFRVVESGMGARTPTSGLREATGSDPHAMPLLVPVRVIRESELAD
jgi:hypothetical protein